MQMEQHAAMLVVCSRKCGIQQYKVNGKAMLEANTALVLRISVSKKNGETRCI